MATLAIRAVLSVLFFSCVTADNVYIGKLPLPQNLTADRIRSQSQCHTYSCSLFWLNREKNNARKTGLKSDCNWRNKTFANHFRAFFERKASWTYLKSFVEQRHFRLCLQSCSFPNFFEFYHKYITFLHEYYKIQLTGGLCLPPFTLNFCYWSAVRFRFNFYFAIVAIPATIVASMVNMATMKQMLGGEPGTALYLHMAEVMSSALFNFDLLFNDGLFFTSAISHWRGSCAYGTQYVSLYIGGFATKYYLRFLNQAFLTAVAAERLYALAYPISFMNGDKKRRACVWIWTILLGTTVLFTPYLILYFLYPIFDWWKQIGVPPFWKENLDRVDAIVTGTVSALSVLLLIAQATCAIFVERLFRKLASQGQDNQVQIRSRDRDKKLLLVGTIGLNIVTGVINNALYIASNLAFYELSDTSYHEFWQINLITMLDPVLNFINGNGSVVIHIILVKSYRQAFGKTVFGKFCNASNVHGNTNANTRGMGVSEPMRKRSSQRSSEGVQHGSHRSRSTPERPRSSVVLKTVYKPRALTLRPPTPPEGGGIVTETDL